MPRAVVLALVVLLLPVATERTATTQAQLWLASSIVDAPPNALATALAQLKKGEAEPALVVLRKHTTDPIVGVYVRVRQGQAELAVGQPDAAAASAAAILKTQPDGYVREAALWLAADAAEARQAWSDAVSALALLTAEPLATADMARAQYRLGKAAEQAGQRDVAIRALTQVHDLFPASLDADEARATLLLLDPSFKPVTTERVPVALRRAQLLFDARRFEDARGTFDALRPLVSAADRDVVVLRLAQCDAQLKRYPAAYQALQTYVASGGPRLDEAEYTRLGVLRDMGRLDDYIKGVRAFVDRAPDPARAHAALNELGTYYILKDDDAAAAAVFTENYDRFPTGAFADRAAWKAGWWAFSQGNYRETVRLFESAAVGLRRSDYRSGWVYWAARAHERLGEREQALAGYQQTVTDYGSSYYGREAARVVEALQSATRPVGAGPVRAVRRDAPVAFDPGAPPSNARLIQQLLSAQLYDDAAAELRRVQRTEGNSPTTEATLAFALNRGGDLRPGISAMKRAYPKYLADGGDTLPVDLRMVLFPMAYWDVIQKHAAPQKLDPFLVAALIAQESTFDPAIRSAANAWGLMQILPATGQRYARTLNIRPFNTASLTIPEINVRIGTAYFSDLVKQFGSVAPALAAYNAGENRVARWVTERRDVDRDEFIDGIPFPETQGYVKKILGTAEDYRALYRTGTQR